MAEGQVQMEQQAQGKEWDNHICGCYNHINLALQTLIVPCVTYGQNTELAGQCHCVVGGLAAFVPIYNIYLMAKGREAIRETKGIAGEFCNDCLLSIFCGFCVLNQVNAEAKGLAPGGVSMSRE
ncbi:PCR12-like protein [Mya arenaria]|uniref:PCR12-like protein n=1 Tax=Mya arenaria TaxID=6604 RepID=A0ABY7EGH7_MYAAR|nr:uncharacterized protein LOC128237238 [Mya arenaria]WAR09097.1 PCR12-like protein [Mya arenaria]